MYSFLQAVQQQTCISNQLTTTSQSIVNCIFCVGIFIDLSRSQGTKDEILLPTPTLNVQSASVCATSSKFPEESTIQHQMSFTPQDTANAPPQMPLDNPEFTAYMSSLLKKESQPKQTHTREVTQSDYSTGNSSWKSQSRGINCVE